MTKARLSPLEARGPERRRLHIREIRDEMLTPLETVGADLRAARTRLGEDVGSVSKALKIRKDLIESIEDSRYADLPGQTYAVGFVRSYAEYLGLDPADCVRRYKEETAGRDYEPQFAMPDPVEEPKWPQGMMVIMAVLLVGGMAGLWYLSSSADRLMQERVQAPPERLQREAGLAPAEPALTPAPASTEAAPRPAALLPEAPAPVAAADPTAPAADAVPPVPAPDAAMAAAPGASAAVLPSGTGAGTAVATPATAEPELPAGQVYGQINADARIILRAREAVLLRIVDENGRLMINRTLQPGDSYRVPNRVGLTITTPNAGALLVTLDGQPMGAAGAAGEALRGQAFDPQSVVDRINAATPG